MSFLAAKSLSKSFGNRKVLSDLDLQIQEKEFVAILGPSGSGKSTLLRLLAGIDQPTSGEIARAARAQKSAFVFQEHRLLPWLRVHENVQIGLGPGVKQSNHGYLLESLGLGGHRDDFPSSLSGGQKMRTSLARALVSNPSLIFMDEPFSALDEMTKDRLQDDLRKTFESKPMTVVFVTHSPAEAAFLADRVITLGRSGVIRSDFLSPFGSRDSSIRSSADFFNLTNQIRAGLRE